MASVIKRGGVWYAKWTDATGRCRRQPTQARSKTEAKALADELEVEARRRRSLVQRARNGLPARPDDLTGTLAELCTWWLDHRCPEASKSGEQHRLRKHVLSAAVGALPLSAVGSPEIDELLHTVEAAGISGASVNKLRSVLHTVFSKAKKAGRWVGENPAASTERRKVARRIYATLRAEEVPLLLAEVPAEWRSLSAAALWTGMRRGELFALRKSDVDLALGTITVQRSHERDTTKGGHADLIPIAAPLLPVLKHHRRARARLGGRGGDRQQDGVPAQLVPGRPIPQRDDLGDVQLLDAADVHPALDVDGIAVRARYDDQVPAGTDPVVGVGSVPAETDRLAAVEPARAAGVVDPQLEVRARDQPLADRVSFRARGRVAERLEGNGAGA